MSKGPAANGRQLTLFQSGFGKEVAPAVPQGPATSSTALPHGSDVITIDDEDEDDVILAMLPEDQVRGLERPSTAMCDGRAAFTDVVDTSATTWPGLDAAASATWVYPINYPLRQYQYSIARAALFSNTLVSLPTGLGKTFIAAVVMYNFYRWYPSGKIVFMAPTKPLVAQQITACFNIVGIPKSDTAEVTGAMSPAARRVLWRSRRVFYLTPQVLINDLTSGAADAGHFCCVVVDEAHKAQGNYAYCMVIRELCRYTTQFRVLALTATPGSLVDNIQQVLSNLLISHIEHRTEESLDIAPYSHRRCLERIVVPIGDTITRYKNKFLEVIGVFIRRIREGRLVYGRSDASITKYMLLKARETYHRSHPPGRGDAASRQLEADFAVCLTLYHALELLTAHGLRCFYSFIYNAVTGDKVSARTRSQLQRNDTLSELLQELGAAYGTAVRATEPSTSPPATSHHQVVPASAVNVPAFTHDMVSVPASIQDLVSVPVSTQDLVSVPASTQELVSHPKLEQLRLVVEQHFQQMAERVDSTRVMIFSQYRDSVLEIVDTLKSLQPTVRAMHFIGQSSGRSSRGFSQKEQLKVLCEFRRGSYNTLVSTCVGEEGLDIGDVDLIICYDVSRSPIRLVQRMGRTGRKRQGRIVVLLTAGREEASYNQSMQQKKSIIKSLTAGTRLQNYLYKNSPRMLPVGVEPKCLRLHMKVAPPSPAASTTAKPTRTRVKRDAPTRSDPTSDLVSRLARPTPRTSDTSDTYLLPHELEDYRRRFQLDEDLLSAVRASVCEWLPWQTTLQCSYAVGHSSAAHALVNALQHMDALAITDDTALMAEHADVRSHLAPDSPDISGVGSTIHKSDQQPTQTAPERLVTSDSLAAFDDIIHLTEQQQMAEAMRQSLLLNVWTSAPSDLDWNQLLFVDSDYRWQGVRSPPGSFEGWTADVDELERLVEVVVEESLLAKNEENLLYAEVTADDDRLLKSSVLRNALPCALKEGTVIPSKDMSFVARGDVLLSEEDQSPILPSQNLTSRRKHRAVIKATHHLGRPLFGSSSPLSVDVGVGNVDVSRESKLPISLTGSVSDDDFQSCDSIERLSPVEAKSEQSSSFSVERKCKLALPLQIGVGEVQQVDHYRSVADQSAVSRCRRSSCDDLFDDDSVLEGMETSLPLPPLIQADSAVFEQDVGAVMFDEELMSPLCPEVNDLPAVGSSAPPQIGAAPTCISGLDNLSPDHQEPLFDLISLDLDSEDMPVPAETDNTPSLPAPASVVELTDEGREACFNRNPSYTSGTNLRPAGGQTDTSPQLLSTAVIRPSGGLSDTSQQLLSTAVLRPAGGQTDTSPQLLSTAVLRPAGGQTDTSPQLLSTAVLRPAGGQTDTSPQLLSTAVRRSAGGHSDTSPQLLSTAVCRSACGQSDTSPQLLSTAVLRPAGGQTDTSPQLLSTAVRRSAGGHSDTSLQLLSTAVCRSAGGQSDTSPQLLSTAVLRPAGGQTDTSPQLLSTAVLRPAGGQTDTSPQLLSPAVRRSAGGHSDTSPQLLSTAVCRSAGGQSDTSPQLLSTAVLTPAGGQSDTSPQLLSTAVLRPAGGQTDTSPQLLSTIVLRSAGGRTDSSPQRLSTAVSTLSSSSPLTARSKLTVTQLIELIDQNTPTVGRSDSTAIHSSSVSASPPGVSVMKVSENQPEGPVFSFLDDLLDEDETQFDADAQQKGQAVGLRPQDERSSTPLHSRLSRGHLGVSSTGQGEVLPSPIAAVYSDVPLVCTNFANPLMHVTPKRRFDATKTPKKLSTPTARSPCVSGQSCSSADTPFGPLARRPGRRNKRLLIRSPSQSPAAHAVSVCQRSGSSTVITIDSEDDDDVFLVKGGGAARWLTSRDDTAEKTADDRRPATSKRTRQPQRDDRSKKQRKGRLRPARNPFLDCEAELSATSAMDDTGGSSEEEQDDDADDSIIDDQPALTQDGIDMRAIYLRSVRSPDGATLDRKLAARRPCTMSDSQIFSQAPIQDAHYIQDSFCVSDDHQDSEDSCSSVCEMLQDSALCRERTPSPQSPSSHGPRRAKRRRVLALPSSGEDSSPSPQGCRHPPVTSLSSPNRPMTPPAATTTSPSRVNPQCPLPSPFKIPFSSPSMLTASSLRRVASPKASSSLSPAAASWSPSLAPLAAAAVSSQRRARLDRARAKQSEYRRRMELPMGDAVGQAAVGKSKHLRRSDSDVHLTPPGTSTAPSENQTVMFVSSREISCASGVVSDLRSVHGVVIHVTSLPCEDYVISSRAAALRCLVSSLNTAAGRKKLLSAVGQLQLMYSRCVLVLERDRVKEAAGAPPPLPLRAVTQLVARLVRPAADRPLHVLHSSGQVDTARLLYAACLSERKAGFCLPLLSTPEQSSASSCALHDTRRRLLSILPGCSVALSETILTRFRTLADFINSGPDEMYARLKGVVSRQRCVEIAQFARRRLMSDLTV